MEVLFGGWGHGAQDLEGVAVEGEVGLAATGVVDDDLVRGSGIVALGDGRI